MTGIPVKQLKDKDGNAIQPNSPDKVGYIDLGSSGAYNLTADTLTTMTEDGWLYVKAIAFDTAILSSNYPTIKINTNTTRILSSGNINCCNAWWLPVKKGDKVTFHIGSASPNSFASFAPYRTNLENGGGGV